MKKLLYLAGSLTVLSMLAMAGTWSGKLLDANCYDQKKDASACAASAGSAAFALESTGKIFKLDAAGNSKAAAALKNRADRSADPAQPQSKDVMAQVKGTEKDGTITVETIDVQ